LPIRKGKYTADGIGRKPAGNGNRLKNRQKKAGKRKREIKNLLEENRRRI
jgi:hypothetical protein